MQPGPSCDSKLNVFRQVWEILGALPGPVQPECVSKASLKETTFCSQVPAGIPTWMSLGRFGKKWASAQTLSSQSWFPELPVRRQLFSARSQMGSQLKCLWAGWGKIWTLPKPVQSELVSRASLKEAAFCNQVPAGIPTCMSLGRFWKNLASAPNLSKLRTFPGSQPAAAGHV